MSYEFIIYRKDLKLTQACVNLNEYRAFCATSALSCHLMGSLSLSFPFILLVGALRLCK